MKTGQMLLRTLNALIILLLLGCGDRVEILVKDQAINAGEPLEIGFNVRFWDYFNQYEPYLEARDAIGYLGGEYADHAGNNKLYIYPVRSGEISVTIDSSPVKKTFHVTVNQDVPISNILVNDKNFEQCIDDSNVMMISELTYLDCSGYSIYNLQGFQYYYALEELRLPPDFLIISHYTLHALDYLSHLADLYIAVGDDSGCRELKKYLAARTASTLNVHIIAGDCDLLSEQ